MTRRQLQLPKKPPEVAEPIDTEIAKPSTAGGRFMTLGETLRAFLETAAFVGCRELPLEPIGQPADIGEAAADLCSRPPDTSPASRSTSTEASRSSRQSDESLESTLGRRPSPDDRRNRSKPGARPSIAGGSARCSGESVIAFAGSSP